MSDALAVKTTLAEAMELAKILADSELVPKEFRGKPANCVVAIKMGESIGLDAFQALQSIAVINGKPSLYGDAGLGVVQASGLLHNIKEEDDGETARCAMWRKDRPDPVIREFSAADAQRIQMYEVDKNGNGAWKPLANRVTWRNHPKRMRQMRARWWVMKDLFPDVLKGLRGAEDVEEATIIDVTPTENGHAPDLFSDLDPKEKEETMDKETITQTVTTTENATTYEATTPPAPTTDFEINGQVFHTAGITRDLMLTMFELYQKVNKRHGKKTAEQMLRDEFHVETRKDLTEEAAQQFIVRLTERLEGE